MWFFDELKVHFGIPDVFGESASPGSASAVPELVEGSKGRGAEVLKCQIMFYSLRLLNSFSTLIYCFCKAIKSLIRAVYPESAMEEPGIEDINSMV